jgi:hypothetical protein
MNDADVKKLYNALSITVNIEAHLNNMLGRGARAGKAWTGWAKAKDRDAAKATKMKDALSLLSKLLKDAKIVLRDLDKATREAGNKQNLDKYATGKEYRDKILAKQLASLRAWEQNGTKFITIMNGLVPPFPFPKPGKPPVDETVTYDSVTNFLHYYGEMKKELAKL